MASVLLDTTVLIDAIRGRAAAARVRDLRRRGDRAYVCGVNVEEMFRGLRPSEEPKVRRMLNAMRIAPLGIEEGRRAGTWRRTYAARGRTLTQVDCLVAAAAASIGARLATGNPRDFPMLRRNVDHWPVGE